MKYIFTVEWYENSKETHINLYGLCDEKEAQDIEEQMNKWSHYDYAIMISCDSVEEYMSKVLSETRENAYRSTNYNQAI